MLDSRCWHVLSHMVDLYIRTQEPVGSRSLAKESALNLSPATLRNIMSDLEENGYLRSIHVSSGRVPTEKALRLYVDASLDFCPSTLPMDVRDKLQSLSHQKDYSAEKALDLLCQLSDCSGFVWTSPAEIVLKKIEFVHLTESKAMMIMVGEGDHIENYIFPIDASVTTGRLAQANAYIAPWVEGRTLSDLIDDLRCDLKTRRDFWESWGEFLIHGVSLPRRKEPEITFRGHGHLLNHTKALDDLKTIRAFFQEIESQEFLLDLFQSAQTTQDVQVFWEVPCTPMHALGYAMILKSCHVQGAQRGALGVIGPRYMDYRKIIPLMHYTSQVIGGESV